MEYEPDLDVFDLFEDGRFSEAASVLDVILDQDPKNGTALGLRSVCARELGDEGASLAFARIAVQRDPENAFAHWTLGAVLEDARRYEEAETAALRCLELAPWHVLGYTLLAHVHFGRGRWPEAIAAADAGLAVDPADEGCQALRMVALRNRDGSNRWAGSLESLLRRFPASSWVRSGQGWAALEGGGAADARTHFEQALTLDPTSEWARSGLIEATKARNPVYRLVLRFFLWFDRLPTRLRWGIIAAGLILFAAFRDATSANPGLAPVTLPLMAFWVAFVLLSWTVRPLSDFLLWLDVSTRRLIPDQRRTAAQLVAGTLGAAIFLGVVAAITRSERAGVVALGTAVLIVPMSAVFHCPAGWPRRAMAWFTAAAAAPILISALPGVSSAGYLVGGSIVMSVVGSWIGNFLATTRPGG
jgi:tetratricopeptide (TPR) repeat protein